MRRHEPTTAAPGRAETPTPKAVLVGVMLFVAVPAVAYALDGPTMLAVLFGVAAGVTAGRHL